MAVKNSKATTQPDLVAQSAAPDFDIESMIADQLLDSVDWSKVKQALIKKAPAKLFAWLVQGNDTHVNISQFPELAALPSSEGEGKAA